MMVIPIKQNIIIPARRMYLCFTYKKILDSEAKNSLGKEFMSKLRTYAQIRRY